MLLFTFINLFLWTQITFGLTLPNTLSQSDINALLAEHNDVRSEVAKGNRAGYRPTSNPTYTLPKATDMIRMEWDDALAKVASDYAATCPTGHSVKASRKQAFYDAINDDCLSNIDYNGNDGIGENMGWSTQNPSISVLTESLDSMNNESDWYQYGNKFGDSTNNYYESLTPPQTAPYPNANDFCLYPNANDFSKSCGHFTQNIWAETRYVGCGFAQCTGTWKTVFVCNYFTAGNYAEQAVYIEGTTSCSNCPAGSTCDSDNLCSYPPTPAPACKPTSPPSAVTLSPSTPPTSTPTAVTPSPVTKAPSVTPQYAACMKLLNLDQSGSAFNNHVWTKVDDWNSKPSYYLDLTHWDPTYEFYIDWDASESRYEMDWAPQGPDVNGGYFTYCDQSNINLCTEGHWYHGDPNALDADATFIPTPCPSPALITDKNEHSISLQSDNNNNNNNVEVFNVTEMHIILCLLIVVVILMCGMIMVGFCYYIKNKNKNGNTSNNDNNDKMEMMYFESQDNIKQRGTPSRGTPIGTDNKNTNDMNQQQLSISITDKKLMKKIQSTTPVTPLIEDEQYDGM